MDLKNLFADEEAVSPVIGVILMVAITVILAAVIASVVLGVGQEAGSTSPTASFSFDYSNSEGNVTITHQSGDSIVAEDVFLRGSGFDTTQDWASYVSSGNASASGTIDSQDAVAAGDQAEIGADSDYEINVVWEDPDGDSSSTLASDSGPDA